MNIYIYGNHSFKKDIHETLEHSNIKFKMDNDCVIKEINDLSVLKQTIKNNPYDVYLIDDEKIIKKKKEQKKIYEEFKENNKWISKDKKTTTKLKENQRDEGLNLFLFIVIFHSRI